MSKEGGNFMTPAGTGKWNNKIDVSFINAKMPESRLGDFNLFNYL